MAYFANNHKNSNQQNNGNRLFNQDLKMNSQIEQKKPLYSNNGYNASNNYKNGIDQTGAMKSKMEQVKQKQKKESAKKAITKAASTAGPVAELATKAALNTPKGQKYLDAYAKADTESEGIRNVKREIQKDKRKITALLFFFGFCLPILLVLFLVILLAKTADSQIYSNENGGTVQSDSYIKDDKMVNIFANYPGLYEKIIDKVNKVGDQYKVEIDRYLVIATLITPINNEIIQPIENETSCGEDKCYSFNGKIVTWKEFLSSWGDQAELLAKMQLLTYTNNQNEIKVNCGSEQTMEQYAQNDLETNEFPWYGWLNPVNWFKGFRDAAGAEVNAKCTGAPNGDSKVPTVRVLSTEQGTYYLTNNKDNEYEYVKDPNSGGVYFWNLLNKNGFIHKYLKDYLSDKGDDDLDKNYEINKKTIIEVTNDIYSYYESIRKDCNGYPVIEGGLDKITFREKPGDPAYTLDFEDVFVGGSVLATFNTSGEVAKAQAIITRSEAYYNIVERGAKEIVGSVTMGCWWWKYNPTYDPSYENQEDNPNYDPDYPKRNFPEIYKAVTETRGIVVTPYDKDNVLETEYDAFCPTTSKPINGFYYLPDGQRNLPISDSYLNNGSRNRAECPCFKSNNDMPGTQYSDTLANLLNKKVGTPAQTTIEKCWTPTGDSKTDEDGNVTYGYKYHATGGHGRGVSQHGMAYFSRFGYDAHALLKLFLERGNVSYGVSFKRLEDSIQEGECPNYAIYKRDNESGKGSGNSGSSSGEFNEEHNHMEIVGGTPIRATIGNAVSKTGHTIGDLNNCIGEQVSNAGMGTREAVVEAGFQLLKCTSDMTGGYTYPYDHQGGRVDGGRNPDINGKLGVNGAWGGAGSGLNCATSVRWALCNGGMDWCTKGSTYAVGMFDASLYPGSVRITLYPNFRVTAGSTSISSAEEAFDAIKPGDLLFSDNLRGGADHIMLIVGKTDNAINIAENGSKTRNISKSELLGSSQKTYEVMLLDDYYANESNRNSLSW